MGEHVLLCSCCGSAIAQPTLEETLRGLSAALGINIEVKYPVLNESEDVRAPAAVASRPRAVYRIERMRALAQEGGLSYGPHNAYVDSILAVVGKFSGER